MKMITRIHLHIQQKTLKKAHGKIPRVPSFSDGRRGTRLDFFCALSSGFTLIEMLISITIFSLAIVTVTGALFLLQSSQQRSINMQNAIDNVRFAIENMAREMRTGDQYCDIAPAPPETATASCSLGGVANTCAWPGGCDFFTFRKTAFDLNGTSYRLSGGVIQKLDIATLAWSPITDPLRAVTSLRFYVSGAGSDHQRRVTIVVKVRAETPGSGAQASEFSIQTTVTKRKLL